MKSVAILLVGLFCGYLILPRIFEHLRTPLVGSDALGYCARALKPAIESYVESYRSEHGDRPLSIPPLIDLIDTDTLKRIETSPGIYVITYNPNMQNDDILVQWWHRDQTAFVRKGGEGEVMSLQEWQVLQKKTEQGAAANP